MPPQARNAGITSSPKRRIEARFCAWLMSPKPVWHNRCCTPASRNSATWSRTRASRREGGQAVRAQPDDPRPRSPALPRSAGSGWDQRVLSRLLRREPRSHTLIGEKASEDARIRDIWTNWTPVGIASNRRSPLSSGERARSLGLGAGTGDLWRLFKRAARATRSHAACQLWRDRAPRDRKHHGSALLLSDPLATAGVAPSAGVLEWVLRHALMLIFASCTPAG